MQQLSRYFLALSKRGRTVNPELTVMTKLFQNLKHVQTIQGSGMFVIQQPPPSADTWHIYFYMGRIVWANSEKHRNRRWLRSLKQHCPTLLDQEWIAHTADQVNAMSDHCRGYWEVQIMDQAMQEGVMTLEQAKAMIGNYVHEIFFSIIELSDPKCQWTSLKELPQQFVWLDIDQVVGGAALRCNQWRSAISSKLQDLPFEFSPDLAPVVNQPERLQERVSPAACQMLTKVLQGQNTLWDVALVMQKPLVPVVKSLLPLIEDNVVTVKVIPDVVLPGMNESATGNPDDPQQADQDGLSIGSRGIIACIDDSPLIGKEMAAMLTPLGYEVLIITDPLQSISALLQKKPRLIFLDLVMPNTNGYEICSFLRKSPVFQNTPIVMLTGHDGVIDRLRAKVVGSTDFLGKPPDAAKVVQVLQRLLGDDLSIDSQRQPKAVAENQLIRS